MSDKAKKKMVSTNPMLDKNHPDYPAIVEKRNATRKQNNLTKHRTAIFKATDDETIKRIWEGMVADALDGDFKARTFVLTHVLGKPKDVEEDEGETKKETSINISFAADPALKKPVIDAEDAEFQEENTDGES